MKALTQSKDSIFTTFKNKVWLTAKNQINAHDGNLFGSRFVGSFISWENSNKVEILYSSKPQKLLVPFSHQLVHFAFMFVTRILKRDSKAMLELVCRKKSISFICSLTERTIDTPRCGHKHMLKSATLIKLNIH